MKAVMHAGGMGIRLSDEMNMRPKPMVKMGDKPILWHIMEIYAVHGYQRIYHCRWIQKRDDQGVFSDCYAINSDISGDLETGKTTIHDGNPDGRLESPSRRNRFAHTNRGRLKCIKKWLGNDETFLFT